MGRDIHMFAEYRLRNPAADADEYEKRWFSLFPRTNPGRNYALFDELTGLFPLRGLPTDAGLEAWREWYLLVTPGEVPDDEIELSVRPRSLQDAADVDTAIKLCRQAGLDFPAKLLELQSYSRNCSVEDAARYVSAGLSRRLFYNDRDWVEHPDWHSATWLKTKEFQQAYETYCRRSRCQEAEYLAILTAMQSLESGKYTCRIIFWFDN